MVLTNGRGSPDESTGHLHCEVVQTSSFGLVKESKQSGKLEMFQFMFFFLLDTIFFSHVFFVVVLFFLRMIHFSKLDKLTKADGRSATSYRTHAAHLRKVFFVVIDFERCHLGAWGDRHTKKGLSKLPLFVCVYFFSYFFF